MTKVKDLITVTCRNILMLKPIDDERYELIDAVGWEWQFRLRGTIKPIGLVRRWHLDSDVQAIIGTFQLGASALCAVSFHPSVLHSMLTHDRANRVYSALSYEEYREVISIDDEAKAVQRIITLLLGHLWFRLLQEKCLDTMSQKDGG